MVSSIYAHFKDPGETLDYDWDFTGELEAGEGIDTFGVDVSRVTLVASGMVGNRLIAIVSGGEHLENARITYTVVTNDAETPRTIVRGALIYIRNR